MFILFSYRETGFENKWFQANEFRCCTMLHHYVKYIVACGSIKIVSYYTNITDMRQKIKLNRYLFGFFSIKAPFIRIQNTGARSIRLCYQIPVKHTRFAVRVDGFDLFT